MASALRSSFGQYVLNDIINYDNHNGLRGNFQILKILDKPDMYRVYDFKTKRQKNIKLKDLRYHLPHEVRHEEKKRDFTITEHYYSNNMLDFLSLMYPTACVYVWPIYISYRDVGSRMHREFTNMLHFIKSCPHNLALFSVSLERLDGDEVRQHANTLIFNKKTGVLFRFDSLGDDNEYDPIIDPHMIRFCNFINRKKVLGTIKVTYRKPPKNSYIAKIRRVYAKQLEESGHKDLSDWTPGGFCKTYSTLFMHYVLFYPDLTIEEIYDRISRDPKTLHELVHLYASFMSKINKTGDQKRAAFKELTDIFKRKGRSVKRVLRSLKKNKK
jgi:hypothetical protein